MMNNVYNELFYFTIVIFDILCDRSKCKMYFIEHWQIDGGVNKNVGSSVKLLCMMTSRTGVDSRCGQYAMGKQSVKC